MFVRLEIRGCRLLPAWAGGRPPGPHMWAASPPALRRVEWWWQWVGQAELIASWWLSQVDLGPRDVTVGP